MCCVDRLSRQHNSDRTLESSVRVFTQPLVRTSRQFCGRLNAARSPPPKTNMANGRSTPPNCRVYPPVADAPRRTSAEQRHATPGQADAVALLEAQIASLKDVAALMREQLEDVRKDRDAWRSQAEGNQRLLSCSTSGQGVALFPQSRLIVGRSGSVRPLPKTEDRAAPQLQRHRRPNAAKAWGTPLGCVRYFMAGP